MNIQNLRPPLTKNHFRKWIGIFLVPTLFACQQTNKVNALNTENINWKSLQFTCSKEQNPAFDKTSDGLFQRAKALEKANNQSNDAEMVHLYQQATKRGHYKAMLHLAGLYIHGMGVPIDNNRAVDLVEKAMKLNAPHAYYLMGVMLHQGIGVKQDKIAALHYFRRSADMGNRYGQMATGQDLFRVFQQQPEPAKSRGKTIGKQLLECALSQDLADAGHSLGMEYLIAEQDTSTALKYFQKAGSLGSEKSLWKLYFTFERGRNGIFKDPQRASCYYKLLEQRRADPNKRFPDIDRLCPLPSSTGVSTQFDKG